MKEIEILKLLETDSTLTAAEIAAMLDMSEQEVKDTIAKCEEDNVILGYTALVDWTRTEDESVTAFIEVRITPQRGDGFDRIAQRIYQYDEVESLYLMSGAYDLAVTITGKTLKEVSHIVSAKLATIDGVLSTATHFILKRYKEKHFAYTVIPEQEERGLFV
jgi:DNA-binding Lrp family transcriptional regulator